MSQHEQEEEGEEGASPKDTAEEKLPGSDSEDSDDDDSLVLYCLPSTIHSLKYQLIVLYSGLVQGIYKTA